ncbi:hypothetical protein MTO96_035506 [Rhipicephalus appendiculatus]
MLPSELVVNYHKRLSADSKEEGIGIESLRAFLKTEVESREKALQTGHSEVKGSSSKHRDKEKIKTPRGSAASLFSAGKLKQIDSCAFCDAKNHTTHECQAQMSLDEKKRGLTAAGRCFRCGIKGHMSKQCRNKRLSYKHCGRRHLSQMCDPSWRQPENTAAELHSSAEQKSRNVPTVLLQTAQVLPGSKEAFVKISDFRNLRSLKAYWPHNDRGDVSLVLSQLLESFLDLEELVLAECDGVLLSTIAKLCPKIKGLKLVACTAHAKEVTLDAHAFPNLERFEISMHMLRNNFCSFLSVTRETVHTACFGDSGMCFEFLHYCVKHGYHLPFLRLEHLALCTRWTLRELELKPRELHNVVNTSPVLQRLETDSYDLRLFFENYYIPRGQLSLSWTGCVCCTILNPVLA